MKIFLYAVMGALNGTICHVRELARHPSQKHGFVNFVIDIYCGYIMIVFMIVKMYCHSNYVLRNVAQLSKYISSCGAVMIVLQFNILTRAFIVLWNG